MSSEVPVSKPDKLTQTVSPLAGYADALVDDTVVLVDGSTTLVGSQSTPVGPRHMTSVRVSAKPRIRTGK